MNLSTLVLEKQDANRIVVHLQEFSRRVGGATAYLISRDGSCICRGGAELVINEDIISALSAGAFASSQTLAELAGEDEFKSIAHQGKQYNLYVTMVGDMHLLLVIYQSNISSVVVRMSIKVTAEMVLYTLEKAYARMQSAEQRRQLTPWG